MGIKGQEYGKCLVDGPDHTVTIQEILAIRNVNSTTTRVTIIIHPSK